MVEISCLSPTFHWLDLLVYNVGSITGPFIYNIFQTMFKSNYAILGSYFHPSSRCHFGIIIIFMALPFHLISDFLYCFPKKIFLVDPIHII